MFIPQIGSIKTWKRTQPQRLLEASITDQIPSTITPHLKQNLAGLMILSPHRNTRPPPWWRSVVPLCGRGN